MQDSDVSCTRGKKRRGGGGVLRSLVGKVVVFWLQA